MFINITSFTSIFNIFYNCCNKSAMFTFSCITLTLFDFCRSCFEIYVIPISFISLFYAI